MNSSKLSGRLSSALGQTKPVIYEHSFARPVAFVHPADLRDRGVRFVDHDEKIVRKKIDDRVRLRAGRPAGQMARIIFDPVAETHFLQHLQIVFGAHSQPLRFEQFVLRFEFNDPLLKLFADGAQRAIQLVRRRDELFGWKKCDDV